MNDTGMKEEMELRKVEVVRKRILVHMKVRSERGKKGGTERVSSKMR